MHLFELIKSPRVMRIIYIRLWNQNKSHNDVDVNGKKISYYVLNFYVSKIYMFMMINLYIYNLFIYF